MYHRYMFVSDIRHRDPAGDREQALAWLQGRLAWEETLDRLRRRAGVLPPAGTGTALGVKTAA